MRTTAISVNDVIGAVNDGLRVDEWAADTICTARNPAAALEIFAHLAARATLAFKDAVSDHKCLFEAMIRRAAAEVLEEIGPRRNFEPDGLLT